MSEQIKTWQQRVEVAPSARPFSPSEMAMRAEIAELRAALALKQQVVEYEQRHAAELEVALAAAQVPSAPVARDLNAEFEAWAKREGLIQESHGIRSTSSMCAVAQRAFDVGAAPTPAQAREPSTLAQQIAGAQAEVATWPPGMLERVLPRTRGTPP